MAEGDVVERVTVEMVGDASKLLDEWLGAKKDIEDSAVELRDSVKRILSEGDIIDVLAGTARELNITLQEAAEQWQNLAGVGGASLEELNGVIARWEERAAAVTPVIEKALQGLADQSKQAGVNLTDAQLEARGQEMLALATHSNSVAEAVEAVGANAQQAAAALGEMSAKGPGGTDAGAWEDWAAPKKKPGIGEAVQGLLGANLKSIVGGVTAATGLYQVGSKLVQLAKESSQVAIESSEAFTQVALSVRANQREYGESIGTIRDYQDLVTSLSQTYAVSDIAVAKATSRLLAQNLTLGLNRDQLKQVTESAVVFAQVYDRDVGGVMSAFTQFLNTGVKQGISNFGLDLEKLELQAGKTFGEMSRQERILALLPELMEKTGAFAEDLAQREETVAGAMKRANAELEDTMRILGTFTSVIELGLKKAWVSFVQLVTSGVLILSEAVVGFLGLTTQVVTTLGVYAAMRKEGIDREEAWAAAVKQGRETALQAADTLQNQLAASLRLTDGIIDETKESAGDLADEFLILGDNADEAAAAFMEMAEEYGKALDKLEKRLSDTLARLSDDLIRDQKDAYKKLGEDLAKIDSDAADRRMKAILDQQITEQRMKEDHLLAMRRLEEDYLLQLEDAVRERDARQVLMLMRQYNLEKKRREEDYGIRQKRMRLDFQLELAEIEIQRRTRQALRIEAYNEEMRELGEQAARKMQEAIDEFEAEKKLLLDEQKKKLDLLEGGMKAEREMRITYMEQIYKDMLAYYGPNGYLEALYKYAAQAQANYLAGIGSLTTLPAYDIQSVQGSNYATTTADPFARTAGERTFQQRYYQRGGEFVATSPTPIMVGERPEMVTVTPLGAGGGAVAGFQQGQAEPIELRVMVDAEDGLSVRVAEQTMSRVADVIVSVTKHAPGGPRV